MASWLPLPVYSCSVRFPGSWWPEVTPTPPPAAHGTIKGEAKLKTQGLSRLRQLQVRP